MITVVNATFFGDSKPNLQKLPEQPFYEGVQYKYFTNNPNMVSGDSWDIIYMDVSNDDARITSKEVKTHIHKFVPDTDYWLWIDNNCQLQTNPYEFLSYLDGCDIVVMPHPERNNIIEEARVLFKWQPQLTFKMQEQIDFYYQDGYVPNTLYETKVLMRRNTPNVRNFNELWWNQISEYSIRDQISFPYVSWKTKTFINTFPGNNSRSDVRYNWKDYLPYWGDVKRV